MKVNYFTFQQQDLRPAKFILTGLHEIAPEDLKKLLRDEHNIHTIDVKKFKPKFGDRESVYYLLYLPKGTKLKQLKEIKALMNTIVRWSFYSNTNKGPTQCRNCQRFGHGSSHCHLPTRCAICSGDHDYTKCTLQEDQRNAIKCSNCNGAHFSNSQQCKARTDSPQAQH